MRKTETVSKRVDGLVKAFYIARKDAKVYYFKAPNLTYGLLMPVSLFLAFSIAGQIDSTLIVAGLTSLAILFGTTSIEAVAVVLEKQTGTFEKLLAAPVSFFTVLLGKALAGFFFGLVIATIILVPLTVVSGTVIASPLLAFIAIAFSSLAFSALGVLVSAYAKWVPEAQMLSNFIRFPMAFLSGAFVALEHMPFQLRIVARFLPLTYSVEALRIAINDSTKVFTYVLDIFALTLFSLTLLVIASKVLQRRIE
ncbi:MAG: ABC transporter permease [Candidatus Bathyarchaeia archaeon]